MMSMREGPCVTTERLTWDGQSYHDLQVRCMGGEGVAVGSAPSTFSGVFEGDLTVILPFSRC